MTEIIEMPKIKELEKLIYNPSVKKLPQHDTDFKIMRIKADDEYTRIDFVYNNGKYGWVQINPKSFIRPVGSEICYPLMKSEGIPFTPKRLYFVNKNSTLYYTLYFAAIPKSVRTIDIIEKEANTPNHDYFNFYGVSMNRVKSEIIEVGS